MMILGINAYHADSSACLVKDGVLVAATEEERFRRIKHWAGFPTEAIRYCLLEAGFTIHEVDHIAISRDPNVHFIKKAWFALSHRPNISYLINRLRNRSHVKDIRAVMSEELKVRKDGIKAKIHHVEHHRAHMASSFFVSPFERAAVISVDALGDFTSTMWGTGKGRNLEVGGQILFPHSLGFLYTAATQYLGFQRYGDEYKVMGLAAYGEPEYLDAFRRIIHFRRDGWFELSLDYFRHHTEGVSMTWDEGEPIIGPLFSRQWEDLFGPARKPGEEITKRHENVAASLQAISEEVYFSLLNHLYQRTGLRILCLAGGVAFNSVANGKIFDMTPFEAVYIQAAAGDAGTAIGAAYHVYHQVLGYSRSFVMEHAYWGPQFSSAELSDELKVMGDELNEQRCKITKIDDEEELCRDTARAIADGKIVGWFQGRMELGPRALGNRSILVDPRRVDMKDVLNARIKRREPFRPFAPSILIEAIGEYFEKSYPDPFMIKVYPIKKEKQSTIPAVTHVDGTGRLQTVSQSTNPLYWQLIKEFEELTGVPIVLNTSFNENEPIVCTPEEAIECFLRTKMDVLVLGNYFIKRESSQEEII